MSGKGPELAAMGEVYFALCKSVDSPVSLTCWLLYKYGEFRQLAEKKVQPLHYDSFARFRDDYLVVSYLSKWEALPTGVDRKAEALAGFTAAETQCKDTNVRLKAACAGDFNPAVEPILLLAQRKIADILEGYTYVDAFENCRWGPGATATLKGADANLVRKIAPARGRISVTRRALPYAKALVESDPAWFSAIAKSEVGGLYSVLLEACFEVVEGNRVTTVPKDAMKDRTIAAEPTFNVFAQLGVGRMLRKALRERCGIDLDDQSRNRHYAKIGSETGQYATIDMKSASDTVSKELVKQLVPYEWSVLLDQLRSPKGKMNGGDWFEYEKFSSMGNGFTFELETLIFYALAVAVAQHHGHTGRVLVYGDDVVMPTSAVAAYREVLSYCGFEVNTKKTHAIGPFRESCGGHYWSGRDVTPVFQKEGLWKDGKPFLPEAYRCANRLLRLAARRGHHRWFDVALQGPWAAARRVLSLLKPRHVVPWDSEGDDGLALPWEDLLVNISTARHGYVKLPVLTFRPSRFPVGDGEAALLAYWLRQSARRKPVTPCDVDEPPWFVGRTLCGNRRKLTLTGLQARLAAHREPFAGYLVVRRRGNYVSRRRMYPIGTTNVAWL